MITTQSTSIEEIEPKLNGWCLALISTGVHGYRFQLHSNPAECETAGEIVCITAENYEKCLQKAIEYCKKNKPIRN